jgi:acetyl esterase/lipase
MPVDPQFSEFLAMFRAMPKLYELPLAVIRSMPVPANPAPTPVDEVADRVIPGPGGDLKLRIYRSGAGAALPLLLFMHGGGFVVGNLDSHDEMARVLTAQTGCVTLSVDYRLAPENPFPAAPDDCYAALKWAAAHARELGADPGRIAVIGDSAGGNLAAVMALRARDEAGPALRGQVLIYPAVDLTATLLPSPDGDYYILTPQDGEFFYRSYLRGESDGQNPYASPGFAQTLRELPPALVITAEFDPLCPQGEAFARKLQQAGVDAELSRYSGAIHGFASFPGPLGRQALRQAADWLKPRLA